MRKNNKSFTLIELLLVISIIGLLTLVIVSGLRSTTDRARIARTLQYQASLHRSMGHHLVGWWQLNEGEGIIAGDISGYNNHGTIYGTPDWIEGVPGTGGNALDFKGSADYINLENSNVFDIKEKITLSIWVKMNSYSSYDTFFWKSNASIGGSESSYGLSMASGQKGRFALGGTLAISNDVFPTETWIHMVGTYDGSHMRLYRDGKLARSPRARTGEIDVSTQDLVVARRKYNTGFAYSADAIIDDVRIYNTTLTTEEIQKIYTETKHNYLSEK